MQNRPLIIIILCNALLLAGFISVCYQAGKMKTAAPVAMANDSEYSYLEEDVLIRDSLYRDSVKFER